MILRRYAAPCPACGSGWILLADVPSRSYVQNYLPGPRERITGDDRWRYGVTSACLRCGAGDTLFALPEGAREYADHEEQAELARGLAQVARGSRPDVEAAWHEALALCHQRAGAAELTVHELGEAIELLWPRRDRATPQLTRLLATLVPYSSLPAARALARTYLGPHTDLCAAELGEVPVVASLLIALASLHVAEGDRGAARLALERAWRIYERAPDPAADPAAWGGPEVVATMARSPGSPREQGVASCAYALLPIYSALGLAAERAACEARVLAVWGPLYGEESVLAMIAMQRDPG